MIGVVLIVSVICIIGGALQVYLSTRKSKWLGLIIPVILLIYSLNNVLAVVNFNSHQTIHITSYDEDGKVIEDQITTEKNEGPEALKETVCMVILVFVLNNIITVICFVIYFVCRRKVKKKQQLDHMQIQDLE